MVLAIICLFVGMNITPLTGNLITQKNVSTEYNKKDISNKNRTSTTLTRYIGSERSSKLLMSRWLGVPPMVQRGDIAFCDVKPWLPFHKDPGYADDHVLMYAGNNRFIESTAIIPWIYNGSKGCDLCKLGVINTSIVFLKLWATNIIYGRVNNSNESQRDAAVSWAESQLCHPYQFGFKPPWPFHKHTWWCCPNTNGTTYNPDTGTYFKEEYYDYWICGELIWGAYKHCNGDSGIDLNAQWAYDKNDDSWHWNIGPHDICDDVDQIYLYTDKELTGIAGTNKPVVEADHVILDELNYSVTLHGKLIDDGGERCHCYVTIIGEGNKYCGFYKSDSLDTFCYLFYGLKARVTYQWYAWAYNSIGKTLGEMKNFTL